MTVRLFALLFTSWLVARVGCAQVSSTSLTGVVFDSQGNRIPQVSVRVAQEATGLTRQTESNSQGVYSFANLPVGSYTIEFSKTGFETSRSANILQTVGGTRTLDARLEVARGRAETTINEALIQLDRSDATVGSAIEQTQISNLPLNGRNWAALTSLAPGATDNGASDQRTIRFAGHGLDDNNLTLDGVDATAFTTRSRERTCV